MPCGGIYPGAPGVTLEELKSFSSPKLAHGVNFACWVCNEHGALHFVEEWDTFIHARCVPAFLQTLEGLILIEHGHTVIIDFSLELSPRPRLLNLPVEQQSSTQGESEVFPPFDYDFDNDPED